MMRALLSTGLLLLGALAVAVPAAKPPADPRSVEVARYDCASELGRREVTLFANGTVRVREGEPGKEWMGLGELSPAELDGAVNRLRDEDLSEVRRLPHGVEGQWIERCTLVLHRPAPPNHPEEIFHFGRYDTLPLALSRVVRVVEDLAARVPDRQGEEQLPADYEPRRGDVLKRVDGNLYRVHGIGDDKKGLELEGVAQPLTIYIRVDQLRLEFVALVSREAEP